MFWLLILISLAEIVLFILLIQFFIRLRKSEDLLARLSDGQDSLLDKLQANAEIERQLMQTFSARQRELLVLNDAIETRSKELQSLIDQAETVSRSPQFLRQLIVDGKKQGLPASQLAKTTGLSLDEVQLIMEQV